MDCRTKDSTNWATTYPNAYDGAQAWSEFLAAPASYPGSGKLFYFEDCEFVYDSNLTDGDIQGSLYGTYGGWVCMRYCTFRGFDSDVDAHGDSPLQRTIFYEVYNNTYRLDSSGPHPGYQACLLLLRGCTH